MTLGRMTLDQLRIFVAVAEREHVTKAAAFLNLTQSAVSHAVTMLEGEFQLALFSRIGRRIVLTEAGHALLEEARALLSRSEALRGRMFDLAGLRAGRLHLHASHTIASYWLPARLNAFAAAHPDIALELTIANTREIGARVLEGTARIGLVEGALPLPDLASHTIARDRLLLVVAPSHPWAQKPPLPTELHRSLWVLREAGSGTRLEFECDLHALGLDPGQLPIMMELASNEAMASTVETGEVAAVLSASVVASRIEAGLLHAVPFSLPDREFRAIHHPQRRLSPAEQAFLAVLGIARP